MMALSLFDILYFLLEIIITFVIVYKIIDSIKKRIKKAAKKRRTPSATTKGSYNLLDYNDDFALVLDNTLKFVDAYLAEFPREWIFMNISTVCEKGEFSTDSYRYYEEFVEFKVNVGFWYEGIFFCENKDAKEYMESIYNYNPSDNAFSFRMRIGDSTNCMIPRDVAKKKFFDCLDEYERNNPNRKLTRTSYGIYQQWNL